MKKIKNRLLNIQLPPNRSAFLWGPRKTGKTFWINTHLSDLPLIDLLKTDVFADFASRPSLLRERYLDHHGLVVIDEIQMAPGLLHRGLAILINLISCDLTSVKIKNWTSV